MKIHKIQDPWGIQIWGSVDVDIWRPWIYGSRDTGIQGFSNVRNPWIYGCRNIKLRASIDLCRQRYECMRICRSVPREKASSADNGLSLDSLWLSNIKFMGKCHMLTLVQYCRSKAVLFNTPQLPAGMHLFCWIPTDSDTGTCTSACKYNLCFRGPWHRPWGQCLFVYTLYTPTQFL